MAKVLDVMRHKLVPRHEILSEAEAKVVLERYSVTADKLPKILVSDPACRAMRARPGQIIKIKRMSETAGTAIAYRWVVGEE